MAILRSLLRLVCSLAVCVFAATIGSAAPAVGLKPAAGPPTTTITVSGSGFAASAAIDVYFDTGDLCLVIASGTGVFSCTIKVAKDVQPQQHWVSAVERGTQMGAQAPFIVRTDWAQFHGRNAAHNGFNRFENTLGSANVANLDILWRASIGASGAQSTPVISGGIVYIGGLDGNLYAFNAARGIALAGFPKALGGPVMFSTAAVGYGNVYIGTAGSDNKLYAFKASNGAAVAGFPKTLGGNINGSPTLYNGNVYVPSYDGKLYAFNANTGAAVPGFPATIHAGFAIDATPSIANDRIFLGSFDSKIYWIDATTGGVSAFPRTTSNSVESTAALVNGEVFVGSDDAGLYGLRASDLADLAGFPTGLIYSLVGSPAVAGGRIIIEAGASASSVYSIDRFTGARPWTVTIENNTNPTYGSPVIANGVVYANSPRALYALNLLNGGTLWRASVATAGLASPAISDGMVFLGSTDGHLYAFSEGGEAPASRLSGGELGVKPAVSSLKPDYSLKAVRSPIN